MDDIRLLVSPVVEGLSRHPDLVPYDLMSYDYYNRTNFWTLSVAGTLRALKYQSCGALDDI